MIDDVEVGRQVSRDIRVAFEVGDAAAMTGELTAAGADLIAAPVETRWRSVNSRLEAPAGLQITLSGARGNPPIAGCDFERPSRMLTTNPAPPLCAVMNSQPTVRGVRQANRTALTFTGAERFSSAQPPIGQAGACNSPNSIQSFRRLSGLSSCLPRNGLAADRQPSSALRDRRR